MCGRTSWRSPPLVVAYALAGTVDIDLNSEPLGQDEGGADIYLRNIWPSQAEIVRTVQESLDAGMYLEQYSNTYDGNEQWNEIPSTDEPVYEWSADSSLYSGTALLRRPAAGSAADRADYRRARHGQRRRFGDDRSYFAGGRHRPSTGRRGSTCSGRDVSPQYFNSFGSRRGNDRVMTRGTFANVRLRNLLVPGSEGGVTYYLPTMEELPIYDAALRYQADGSPLIVLAGKDYGMGSSRDWAAERHVAAGHQSGDRREHRADSSQQPG